MLRNKGPLVGVLLLAFVALSAFPLAAQTAFKKSKLYVTEEHKMKLRKVELTFTDTALVIQGVDGKYREKTTVPYAEIKKAEYEFSKHHRAAAAIIISPLFLLSKAKKHWLALVCKPVGEDEEEKLLFRLNKSNYTKILDAFENSAGIKVEMVPTKG
jgi:RES domain-containing protein